MIAPWTVAPRQTERNAVDLMTNRMATMAKWIVTISIPVSLVMLYLVVQKRREDRMQVAYERIVIGMDLASVESLMGSSGTPIVRGELPRTRNGYVVHGDTFYEWTDDYGNSAIIAFVEDRVHDKRYRETDF